VKDNSIDEIVMGESLEKISQQNMIDRLKNKIDYPLKWEIVKRVD
jgi:hypothetical protein